MLSILSNTNITNISYTVEIEKSEGFGDLVKLLSDSSPEINQSLVYLILLFISKYLLFIFQFACYWIIIKYVILLYLLGHKEVCVKV